MFNKLAAVLIVSIAVAVILLTALCIYVPAFTAYADDEQAEETITTMCIKIAPSDLEHNAYSSPTTVAVKDFDTDETIFYLPDSYFLTGVVYRKIAKFDFEYYEFSYAGLDTSKWYIDYSETLSVESVTFTADETPFPDIRLTLIDTGATIYLDNDTVLTNEYTIKFIGFNETGDEFYISATKDGVTKYAMVGKTLFTDSYIPYQARTQEAREQLLKEIAATPKAGDIVPNTSKTLRIILIIGICIPAALIVILLFKPTRGSQKRTLARERGRDEFDYDERREYRRDRYDDRRDARDDRRDDRRDYRDDRRDDYRDDRRDYRDERRDDYRDDRR
ncbi:MAG: hypothetical protein IJ226_02010 [Clostridia bacterium]|nr:hypothetical protein [Clostridia bacterium]